MLRQSFQTSLADMRAACDVLGQGFRVAANDAKRSPVRLDRCEGCYPRAAGGYRPRWLHEVGVDLYHSESDWNWKAQAQVGERTQDLPSNTVC